MTRRTLTCAGLAALGLFFMFASSGYAGDVVYHGSICNPVQEQVGQVFYNQWGIANLSSSSALSVACGTAMQVLSAIINVSVSVYDRNPTADVVCTLVLVDLSGVPLGPPLSVFSSGSQVGVQTLNLNLGGMNTATIILQCSLPPATSSGVSHLTTYRVTSTP